MNQSFEPLFFFVANMDLVGQLIEQQYRTHGNLDDLAFCAEYDLNDQPGRGQVSVYRRSAARNASLINVGQDNMQGKLWFVENEAWRVERFSNPPCPGVQQFTALVAFNPSYRPRLLVDKRKPLLSVTVWDLPLQPQYPQVLKKHPAMVQRSFRLVA